MPQPGRWVERETNGSCYRVWQAPMPWIPDEILNCAVYLYRTREEADVGTAPGGTGFLLAEHGRGGTHVYVVTNEHVSTDFPVVRITKRDGTIDVKDLDGRAWITPHSRDDLAIAALDLPSFYAAHFIVRSDLLTPQEMERFKLGPGDNCLMIGRFVKADNRQRDRPVVRFGNIAMMPDLIHQSKRDHDQESFLVDMRSISGFSGSVVVVYYGTVGVRPGLDPHPPGGVMHASEVMNKAWVLGIDWGHITIKDDRGEPLHSGLAGVVPAWKVNELLEDDRVVALKEAHEDLWKQGQKESGAVLDSANASQQEGEGLDVAAPRDDSPELERFEKLTEKLLRVSKGSRLSV
jgi:hypothetical protein